MRLRLLVALLALGIAAPAMAADRTNYDIFKDVSKQVNRYVFFTIFDSVHANVQDGVVTLTGKVTMPFKSTDLAKRVAKIDGVTKVRNRIEVLPVSRFDNDLRLNIARALYSHPALSMYALGPNPSIHVVVERGRVTLDGVVNNDADRIIADALARQFGSFSVTNALKTDQEVTRELEKL